jgi:hypothetical protein
MEGRCHSFSVPSLPPDSSSRLLGLVGRPVVADAYVEDGRCEQAERTARQELACADSSNLELRALIRKRLQEIREARGREK